LLRMCNDLLRRLSRSQNTIFCGRIQLFLAHLFPLKEKSGLNLVSQFNIENKTIYNAKSEFSPVAAATAALKKEEGELDGSATDAESSTTMETTEASTTSAAGSAAKPEEPIIDHVLYKKFWSLQDFFNKPTKLYDKANWKTFHSHLNAVIKVFESYKLDDVKVMNKGATSSSSSSSLSAADDVIFAKYLTNEKLLDLQLNDSTVRRNILLQLLIVFQYLNAPVKFKMPTLVLNEDQDAAVKHLTEKVYALLKETPPDGEQFADVVKHVLGREEFWNNWKNEGCPPFDKPKTNATVPIIRKPRKKPVGEDVLEGDGTIKMGAAELTRLWNLEPDNLKACASESRVFLPSLELFLEDALEQTDPEAQIEDEYKLINDQGWCWRALRLLARKSSHFWAPPANANQQNKKLSQGLEALIVKVGRDFPSTKEKESGGEEDSSSKGVKEEGELDDDGTADNSNAVQTSNADEEEEEEELLKSAKMENDGADDGGGGEGSDKSWMDRDITRDVLHVIAKRCNRNIYRKLGHELNFAEDDMAAFEVGGGESEEHCLKMLTTWIDEEGEKATFAALVNALMGVQGLKSIVGWLKDGGEEGKGEKRGKESDDADDSEGKKKKTKIEPI